MKVITTVNQTEGKDLQEPIRIQSKITKLPEAQENADIKSWLVLVLHLIDRESGALFWTNNYWSKAKRMQSHITFNIQLEISLIEQEGWPDSGDCVRPHQSLDVPDMWVTWCTFHSLRKKKKEQNVIYKITLIPHVL